MRFNNTIRSVLFLLAMISAGFVSNITVANNTAFAVTEPITADDYSGLWRTGVNDSNGKLVANRSDTHWTYGGAYNGAGLDPCQDAGHPAITVYEKGDPMPYVIGGDYNAALGATWPSDHPDGNFSWLYTDANARWISHNAEGVHDSSAGCPDPSGGADVDPYVSVRNSNSFSFKLTDNFIIKDGIDIDKDSLRLNMSLQTDNLIRVRVNGQLLYPTGGTTGGGPCNQFIEFLSTGYDHEGYICPNFQEPSLSSLQLANGDAFNLGDAGNTLSVEIFSTFPNVGFIIGDITLSGSKGDEPIIITEDGCRPIPKYTIPKATDYGEINSNDSEHPQTSGPQIVEYALYDNGVPKFTNSSLTENMIVDLTSDYTDGNRHNITIHEISDHITSITANHSPVVCPTPPATGDCTGGDFTGWSISRAGPASAPTAPAPATFICFDYKLKTDIELSGNKFEGGTDFNISMSVNNDPYTKDDSVWGGFYNEYITHTKSKLTQWQISMLKVGPGVAMPSYTRPGGFAIDSGPCAYYGFGSGCDSSKISGITSTSSGITYNKGSISFSQSTTIPDVVAGTKYCLAFSVKPSTSENSNSSDTVNDTRWSHSPFDSSKNCFIVAKKPKVQVWGGDLVVGHKFSDSAVVNSDINNVKTNSVYKNNLNRTFGSWTEYGVFANGTIKGIASGSAFNNISIAGVKNIPQCNLSKLSFIHMNESSCSDNGHYSISDYIKDASAGFGVNKVGKLFGNVNLSSIDEGVYDAGDVTINSSDVIDGKSIVIKSDGNVRINSDIKYKDKTYYNIGELPQVVIIAKNIIIDDNVTNLDSWLVANNDGSSGGYIDMCATGSAGSALLTTFKCKNRLVINGAIESKRLYLDRTFGAEPGDLSGQPAETLNLRADAYLWGYNQASKNGNIITVYTYEAPVRF